MLSWDERKWRLELPFPLASAPPLISALPCFEEKHSFFFIHLASFNMNFFLLFLSCSVYFSHCMSGYLCLRYIPQRIIVLHCFSAFFLSKKFKGAVIRGSYRKYGSKRAGAHLDVG